VLNTAGRGCLITKTDWAAAYKHICVRAEDLDLQWFSWAGKFFMELCLIFGSASSAGIFDDAAKLVLDLVCRRANFPKSMVCQHLDDVCAAAAAGSDALHRLDTAFQEIAADIGVELAPREDKEKSFAPSTEGVVFGVSYDTVSWTWAIPQEKLDRICNMLADAIDAESVPAKEFRSLAGKLIHVKPLVPAGRFNIDKIIRTYAKAARTEDEVNISSPCRRQLRFWLLFLRVCSGAVDIPRPVGAAVAGALDAYTDAAGGSCEAVGRGTGGVLGSWWYYIPWAKRKKRRGLESRRKKSGQEAVGVGTRRPAHRGGRCPQTLQGAGPQRLGGQQRSSRSVPERIQQELPPLHNDCQGCGDSGGGDRLQNGGPKSDALFSRWPKNGGPPVESQVQGVQGGSRQELLAPADGAGGYSEGAAEMARQARALRRAGGRNSERDRRPSAAGWLLSRLPVVVLAILYANSNLFTYLCRSNKRNNTYLTVHYVGIKGVRIRK
jgi:hypothetical protein